MAKKKRTQGNKGTPADGVPALSAEERAARREQQRQEWASKKRKEERAARSMAPFFWIGGGLGAVLVGVVIVFVLIGGGGDDNGGSGATQAPDPRVGNAVPEETFTIVADDEGQATNATFDPTVLNVRAGEVFEVVLNNIGSVHHNLNISGADKEYGTLDDWVMDSVAAGDEGRIKVKINDPGTYPFHCDFHPEMQKGNLIVS